MIGDGVEGRESREERRSRCEVGSSGLDGWGKMRSMKLLCILFFCGRNLLFKGLFLSFHGAHAGG
jgi:hypothetical protein